MHAKATFHIKIYTKSSRPFPSVIKTDQEVLEVWETVWGFKNFFKK